MPIGAGGGGFAPPAPYPGTFPLRASSRYIVGANGLPLFIHGDTPWSMPASLTDAEIDTYIDNRAAKGFTAILLQAPVFKFTSDGSTNNIDGVEPFTSMTGNWNWTLNNTYWNRVDRIVNRCKTNGIIVFINPAYWGFNGGDEGCYTQCQAQSDATLQAYGAALANRYTQGNIVWCLGGDYDGVDGAAVTKQWQIVVGIRSVRTTDIITAHGAPGSPAYSAWNGQVGFNLNSAYPGDTADIYSECDTEYARSGPIPFVMLEGIYEQERAVPISAAGLRRQSYQAICSGACGQFFGNSPIWHFESINAPFSYTGTWETNLDSTGSTHQQYVKQLISAYHWWKLVPTSGTSLVSSALSSGDSRICPALANDGTFAFIWVPSSQTITVVTNALTGVSGNVRIRRFNPTDGTYTTINASVAKTSAQSVATGAEGVIVVDAA